MSRQQIPLTALRAFEAAARHLSFTKAAEELGVTPAAISNHIKALEEQYGVQLFHRLTRAVTLTDAGHSAMPLLRQGFDKLSEAADRIETLNSGGTITVSVLPFFASKWLVPRLHRFYQMHADIDVRIDASMRAVDLVRDSVDVCVRLGRGNYTDLDVVKLFDEKAFPVCSPQLLEEVGPLNRPKDLRHHTLLHIESDEFYFPEWHTWLKLAGVEGIDASRGPRFNQLGLQVQAAVEGHGVALASSVLVTEDLDSGRLVRPFDLAVEADLAYYLLRQKEASSQPLIAAFCEWVLSETSASPST
jgi:LysR family glycine cleavage system transcriptional activator